MVATDAAGNQTTEQVRYQVVAPQCVDCRLLVSRSRNRTSPQPLDGATTRGLLYIFITPDPSIRSVCLSLDGGRYVSTDRVAPWDLVSVGSRALPVPSLLLSPGPHRVTARLALANGTTRTMTATLTIAR